MNTNPFISYQVTNASSPTISHHRTNRLSDLHSNETPYSCSLSHRGDRMNCRDISLICFSIFPCKVMNRLIMSEDTKIEFDRLIEQWVIKKVWNPSPIIIDNSLVNWIIKFWEESEWIVPSYLMKLNIE